MTVFPSPHQLKTYVSFEDKFCELLEASELSKASARLLAKLAKALLRGLKKSISALQRLYFPEATVQNVLKHLRSLIKKFHTVNEVLIDRIRKSWDKRRRVFVICDDYLLARDAQQAYRTGFFRDPVVKKVRHGHNVVDTIIATGGIEISVDFALQPKGAKVPKTQRGRKQLLHALSIVDQHGVPQARIRVLIDGGYTNNTVLPQLREQGRIYLGTVSRRKHCNLFGENKYIKDVFPTQPGSYLTVGGKRYYYEVKRLNVTDWGCHQVFIVRKPRTKEVKYYLTNDLKMTPATFLRCQHERWWIEQNHRDLKQFCALDQLFVWKKRSVESRIALSYLVKNFLALLIAEAGLTMRDCPIETLVEKEFGQVEQFLIQTALNSGMLEEFGVV